MNRTQFKHDLGQWSDQIFGEGLFYPFRSIGCAHHLQEETSELIEALENYFTFPSKQTFDELKEELADCSMLLTDIARLLEISDEEWFQAEQDKLKVNKQRKWGKPDENGSVNHIKST